MLIWFLFWTLLLALLLLGLWSWHARRPPSRRAAERRRQQALALERPLPATSWQRRCRLGPAFHPLAPYLEVNRIPGVQLLVVNRDGVLLERVLGDLDVRRPRHIASASKWLRSIGRWPGPGINRAAMHRASATGGSRCAWPTAVSGPTGSRSTRTASASRWDSWIPPALPWSMPGTSRPAIGPTPAGSPTAI